MNDPLLSNGPSSQEQADRALSVVVIKLLKGVLYQEDDLATWSALLRVQPRVQDHVAVLGLQLVVDETEGHAYLRSRQDEEAAEAAGLPHLVTRRPLSYPVSLLLALLRRKLLEFDAAAGETRLVLSKDEIVEMIRLFLADSSNEARLIDQVDATLNKVAELGFVRRLRGEPPMIEVRRIIKAYIDAQWLADFDQRLAAYREQALLPAKGDD